MENKKSIKVYFEEYETHYIRKASVVVNEDTHPELKGMSEEEMVKYVEENISSMKAVNPDIANLEDEVMYAEEDWDRYYNESSKTVVEVATDEDFDREGEDD